MTKRSDITERRLAEALGRPVKVCPACGALGASHWEPAALDEDGFMIPGYYTCAVTA